MRGVNIYMRMFIDVHACAFNCIYIDMHIDMHAYRMHIACT